MMPKKRQNNTLHATASILYWLWMTEEKQTIKKCADIGGCSINTAATILKIFEARGFLEEYTIVNPHGQKTTAYGMQDIFCVVGKEPSEE